MRKGRSRSCPNAESFATGLRSSVTFTSSSLRSSTNLWRLVTVKKTVTSSTRLRMVHGSGTDEEESTLEEGGLNALPLTAGPTPGLRQLKHSCEKVTDTLSVASIGRTISQTEKALRMGRWDCITGPSEGMVPNRQKYNGTNR